ncbi:hypothetical protein JZ751_004341 [Albula glossodonta]|uniref:Myotubularin phosphatase domain-containing protein n=1 Tax=Albula glossodonta TaxID=121402 RepID=A0A8T2ND60_9TELE|nr:hypothetical protein JZ751_004341 [Albula glossodonta]
MQCLRAKLKPPKLIPDQGPAQQAGTNPAHSSLPPPSLSLPHPLGIGFRSHRQAQENSSDYITLVRRAVASTPTAKSSSKREMGSFGAAYGWERTLNHRGLNTGERELAGLCCLPEVWVGTVSGQCLRSVQCLQLWVQSLCQHSEFPGAPQPSAGPTPHPTELLGLIATAFLDDLLPHPPLCSLIRASVWEVCVPCRVSEVYSTHKVPLAFTVFSGDIRTHKSGETKSALCGVLMGGGEEVGGGGDGKDERGRWSDPGTKPVEGRTAMSHAIPYSLTVPRVALEFYRRVLPPCNVRGHDSAQRALTEPCLKPGERVLQRAVLVRKKLCSREGGGWLAGTLFCTHFRLAFVPQDGQEQRDGDADPLLLGEHDVALTSIEKVVAVGPFRVKHVTPSSALRFTPEQLILYCRDMRVLCFLFDRLTPEAQVLQMTYTLARAYQPLRPSSILSFQNAALGSIGKNEENEASLRPPSLEMKQLLSNRRRDPSMNWFEGVADWEAELERTGTMGWRVSSVNDRFEMATRYNVVPQRVLDTELKRTFAHFHEGRIPVREIPTLCFHRNDDLLRMAAFQNNIYHEKDDIRWALGYSAVTQRSRAAAPVTVSTACLLWCVWSRNLEALLFGVQQRSLVVEVGDDMPSTGEIQLAHTRLRALCLGADISSSLSAPDEKWLSSLEATHWLDHVRYFAHLCCLKKATEVSCLLRDGHLTVILQEPEDRDMNCVVSALVQVMCDPHCRTLQGFQGLVQKEWVGAGHRFLSRANYYHDRDREEAPVFLLFLDCVWQLWAQFPSYFQLTEEYLQALHDSTHLPLYCTYLYDCQRERSRRSQHLPQSYTPIDGWWEGLAGDPTPYPMDPPLPPVWDWALCFSPERRGRFTKPMATPTSAQPVLNGNLSTCQDDGAPDCVFLFSRGAFSSPSLLLPWRATGSGGVTVGGAISGASWRSHRHAPPLETPVGLERLLRGASTPPSGPQEPLLPLLLSPCLGLWRACYIRGPLQAQAFPHPAPVPGHPMDVLAREVEQLRERLESARAVTIETESHDYDYDCDSNGSTPYLVTLETLEDSMPNSDQTGDTILFSAT